MRAEKPSWFSRFKNIFLPAGKKPRSILFGPFRGIRMSLCLHSQTQLFLGIYEKETQLWLKKFSRGIRSAIDVGADEGEHTLYFLAKTRAERVFSFEPTSAGRQALASNLALNGLKDPAALRLSEKLVGAADSGDMCTLDSIAPSVLTPCVVKIDVDGPEVSILKGAQKLLQMPDVRWIVEVHAFELEKKCLEILSAAGYTTRIIPNAWWRTLLPELRPGELNRWVVAFK